MTQEQFNKVCEIVREIDSLESAKKEISKKKQILSYTDKTLVLDFAGGIGIMKNGKL